MLLAPILYFLTFVPVLSTNPCVGMETLIYFKDLFPSV